MTTWTEAVRWRRARSAWAVSGGLLLLLLLFAFWRFQLSVEPTTPQTDAPGQQPIQIDFGVVQPLPRKIELDPGRVELGERLFHEVRLSGNDSIGCFSCHALGAAGVDNRVHSLGVNGTEGEINAPTVFNSGFNFVQFWDGRAATLEEQIDGPINNPKEMASNWPLVVAKLSKDTTYVAQFDSLYKDGITVANIKNAIATFERSLVTPDSRFDKYLRGEKSALTEHEIQGFRLFQAYGCSSCHQGVNLGGNMYEKMGLMGDYFADRGNLTEADLGRFKVNHIEHSRHEFKVPSLRNVARTAPYFHDGNARTLEDAVLIMAKYQLGRPMTSEDVGAIVAFLGSLTGEYKGRPL